MVHGIPSKHRILHEVNSGCKKPDQQHLFHPLPVFCGVIAALLIAVVALNSLQPVAPAGTVEMNVFAAGIKETVMPSEDFINLLEGIDPADVLSVELPGIGMIDEPEESVSLINILIDEAEPALSDTPESCTDMIIRADDGKVIRFDVKEPYLFKDGCWSCQGFFRLFHQLLNDKDRS